MTTSMPQTTRTAQPYASDETRWKAVSRRSVAADGYFVYAVRTTGVYCRPSCPARPALRQNVSFYDSTEAARAAGYRACKRCKPDEGSAAEQRAALIARACRLIDNADEAPNLDALAAEVGLSAFYFHRLFKTVTGLTPRAYAKARRQQKLQAALPASDTVTDAMYDAGYQSSGRFYADSPGALGMTPKAFRSGGKNEQIRFAVGATSLGAILVAETAKGICAITLGDDPEALVRDLQDRFPKAELIGADTEFERRVATVVGFVEAPALGLDLPLDIRGTAFQQRVWQALREIPAGATASYSDIAEKIGQPAAVRAVAQACAANKLAVAIPCHRVVRTDGALSGYRWGVERKRELLEREGKS